MPSPAAPVAPVATARPVAQQAPVAPVVDTINVYVQDENRAMSALQRKLDDMAFRNRGTRGQPGRYALGD